MFDNKYNSVLAFINALKQIDSGIEDKCLCGSCFQLYLLLKTIWQDAEAWYDGDHVIIKIGELFYDIRGEVIPSKNHIKMQDDELEFNRAYFWDLN